MMQKSIILILCLVFAKISFAQNEQPIEKAPKQVTVEMGYRYITENTFDNKTDYGYTLMLDYGWKLSGFNKKKAIYLSVPLGYTYLPASNKKLYKDMRILSYGWTVTHELKKDIKFIPFIGYGLLLNQLSITDSVGSVMGHQTRFDFGVKYNSAKRIKPFVKLEYTYSSFPRLGIKTRNKLAYMELKLGIKF